MRIAILSDIHGNLPALEAVFDDLKKRKPDGLIFAGDFIGGPHPNQSIELLKSFNPNWMILGNSDINVLRYIDGQVPLEYRTSKQFALLRWACNTISKESLAYLRTLPRQQVIHLDNTASIRVVHGSLDDPYDGYDPVNERAQFDYDLSRLEEGVLICGHTHCPWIVEQDGKLAFNPGSVAGPLNGFVGTQYALLDQVNKSWKVQLIALTYDMLRIRNDFSTSGLLEAGGALARCFLRSIENGANVSLSFLQYASTLADKAGKLHNLVIPDDIWSQAEASFDWNKYEMP